MEEIIEQTKKVIEEMRDEVGILVDIKDIKYYEGVSDVMDSIMSALEKDIVPKINDEKAYGYRKEYEEGVVYGIKKMRDTLGFLLRERRKEDDSNNAI